MATVGANSLTLNDLASRMDKDSKIAPVIEILSETNEIMEDMKFMEANEVTSHSTVIRSGLPESTWRLLNYGVQPSKSRTVMVKDSIGQLEAYSEIDKKLADLNGNTAAFRLSEDTAFLESMSQEVASTVFYGSTVTDPEKFMGLAPRFNDTNAENGENIILGAVNGNTNTSIWLVGWGDKSCHGIYPKGSQAGFSHSDLGEDTLTDAAGGLYQGYRSHYKFDVGLTVRDWRYIVRIQSRFDTLTSDAATGDDLVDLMDQAIEQFHDFNGVSPVFYCNRKIRSFLRRQIKNASNVRLSLEEIAGKKVVHYDGIPVKVCDSILNTEAAIS